jgi:hypothetical protein
MGRPSHGAMSSFSGSLIQRIEQMRKQHRGWGPTTILAELKYEGQWSQEELPSRSTIGRLLQQQKWSRTYEPNVALPVEDCTKAKRCHSLWQVDGQGNSSVAGIGTIAMLNIKDVFSSLYVCSFPARMKSKHGHPCTSDYQTAMRLGFVLNDKELVLTTLPIKGISCESLMGDLEQTAQFPNFQLELPLYWEAQKLNTTFSDST